MSRPLRIEIGEDMRHLAYAVVAVLFAAGGLSADDSIDATKLIGKWVEQGEKKRFVVEFQEAGKVVIDTDGDTSERVEGTYQLDGNTLELRIKRRTGDLQVVRTITKLTDEEFVSRDEGKKEDTPYRVKGKKASLGLRP
jgi:uncharacterized protein (TIGR03066 family)